MFRIITNREEYKSRPRFRNPSPAILGFADVSGAALDYFFHLDAADAVQGATSWTSKEGKVFTSSAINKVENGINGHPIVNGSEHNFSMLEGITQNAGNTIFVVGVNTGFGGGQRVVSQNAGPLDFQTAGGSIPLYLNGAQSLASLHINVGIASPIPFVVNAPALWVSRREGTQITNSEFRQGASTTGATQATNAVTAAFTLFSVGGGGDVSWTNGQVAEVIYYSRHLPDPEFEVARDFLRAKYALT